MGTAAVLALLPLCSQAASADGRYAVMVNTLWPTCEPGAFPNRVLLGDSVAAATRLQTDCTADPQAQARRNAVGLVALEALEFSNKPQWARTVKRLQHDGLRLMSVRARSTTFYVGVSPDGVAGLHFVGTLSH